MGGQDEGQGGVGQGGGEADLSYVCIAVLVSGTGRTAGRRRRQQPTAAAAVAAAAVDLCEAYFDAWLLQAILQQRRLQRVVTRARQAAGAAAAIRRWRRSCRAAAGRRRAQRARRLASTVWRPRPRVWGPHQECGRRERLVCRHRGARRSRQLIHRAHLACWCGGCVHAGMIKCRCARLPSRHAGMATCIAGP
eukprot:264770-Chlamydomonas_euryale.AAC.1